ncbi:MAG: S1 RNA-binding domain-containing protein [Candidatus Aenigmarchaeota archaeon]|nr:S1 RNA-binding domain-containing protein [Candidatus Aenigmarchaeota archaeon]
MGELLKKERDFTIPGDKLVESMEYLPGRNCFRDGDGIYAKKLGLVHISGRVLSVIALNGIYMPQRDDMIIGEVTDIQSNGWVVDIGAPYQAYLPLSGVRGYLDPAKNDMSKVYDVGDMIYGKIKMVSSTQSVHISMFDRMCRKFSGGRILNVNPAKVPRIIGKSGSMIDMIKRKTGCRIIVGQNGIVWLEGETHETENFVIDVIETIQKKSHIEGLTNEIEKMLDKRGVKNEKE